MARFKTKLVMLNFPNLLEPKLNKLNDKVEYSTVVLIPKSDKATIKALEAAIEEVYQDEKAKFGLKAKSAKDLKSYLLKDGDDTSQNGSNSPDNEAYKGKVWFRTSSNYKPQVFDKDNDELVDSDDIFSGCHGRVIIELRTFAVTGNAGVKAYLSAFKRIPHPKDERLGGGSPDYSNEWDDDDDDEYDF